MHYRMYVRGALRQLLQADRPVVLRSQDEITAEVERNYRWNFTVNLLDGATFWFGVSFISATTIVPLFISKLTDSPFAIGLAAVIAQGAWFLPQLFTARVVERLPRKKPVVINLGFFLERLPMWLLVGAALLAGRWPLLALAIFFIGYAWRGFGGGLVATSWQDMIASCFPLERRGRFLGTTMFIGAGSGALAAGFSAWLLENFLFPTNFVYIFAIAALAITVSWAFLALTREPARPTALPPQSSFQFWSDLPAILRRDENFRRFLIARMLLALAGMGTGFVTVAAIQRWQVPDSVAGLYTASYLAGQTASNLASGLLADKFGHKLSLTLSGLASFLAFALAWLAPAPVWYVVVFLLLGAHTGAFIVSGILVVMEFCPPPKRPTYIGLANTGVGLASVAAPLLGAWLAQRGYNWLFLFSAAIGLLSFVLMHWRVEEPRFALGSGGL